MQAVHGCLHACGSSQPSQAGPGQHQIYPSTHDASYLHTEAQHFLKRFQVKALRKRLRGSDIKLVLAGCVAQQEGAALLRRVPELDVVMGPQHANQCAPLQMAQQNKIVGMHIVHSGRGTCWVQLPMELCCAVGNNCGYGALCVVLHRLTP